MALISAKEVSLYNVVSPQRVELEECPYRPAWMGSSARFEATEANSLINSPRLMNAPVCDFVVL